MESSMISLQGVVLATFMAVSSTVVLLALRLQKSLLTLHQQASHSSFPPILRSCISSGAKREKRQSKKKKRVHFTEDVVDSSRDGEEFWRKNRVVGNSFHSNSELKIRENSNGGSEIRGMPSIK